MTNREIKEQLVDTIALLNVSGIGRGRFNKLVRKFGSASKVLHASIKELEAVGGISHGIAHEIKNKLDLEKARQTAAQIVQLGWTVLFADKPGYPKSLANLSENDRPPLLFSTGPCDTEVKMLAIVGTRHPTEQGRLFAYNLAQALARSGISVVSGMAEGIDAAAHKGALDAGGHTVAVWGSALDVVYPPSNKQLAGRIQEHGLVYSEYFPGTSPEKAHFPQRNRIIAGLSEGVVVVEAGRKSGALITADQALAQGRELFAVPGGPNQKMSEGSNDLIKKGARLVTSVEDIFVELPRLKGRVASKKFVQLPDLTDIEKKIVSSFADGPKQIDDLARATDLTVNDLMEFLLALELKGILRELSGKRFMLTEDYQ